MVSLARKEIWFRGIFHLIGILGESPFVSKLRKAESAQHSVKWTPGKVRRGHEGGYAPRLQPFFSASGFFPFDSKSQPTPRGECQSLGGLGSPELHKQNK